MVNILCTVSLWYLADWEQDFLQINTAPAAESTWILLDIDTVKINEIKVLIFNCWYIYIVSQITAKRNGETLNNEKFLFCDSTGHK